MNKERRKEWLTEYRRKNPDKFKYNSEDRKRQRRNNPIPYLLHGTKQRAKRKGIEFSITADDLIMPEYCPVFFIKLECGEVQQDSSPSIDRIDNTKGYIPGNVEIISWKANNAKSNLTIKELERLLNYMKEKQ